MVHIYNKNLKYLIGLNYNFNDFIKNHLFIIQNGKMIIMQLIKNMNTHFWIMEKLEK